MRYGIAFLSLALSLGACAAPTAQAEPAKPAPTTAAKPAQPAQSVPPLTADQLTRIAQLRIDMQTKVAPLRAQAQVKHLELQKLWMAKEPRRDDIVRTQNELSDVERKIKEARVDFRLAVLSVLTPEQRAASGPGTCQTWAAGTGVCAALHAGPGGRRGGRGQGRGPWQDRGPGEQGKGMGPRRF